VGSVDDGTIRLSSVDAGHLWPVLDAVRQAGAEVAEVLRPRPSLQDVFVRAIREDSSEEVL